MKHIAKFQLSGISKFLLILLILTSQINTLKAQCSLISGCDDLVDWNTGTINTTKFLKGTGSLDWKHGVDASVKLTKNIDFSDKEGISFWVYSDSSWNKNIVITLGSDNSSTAGGDYYRYDAVIVCKGWKNYRIPFSEFKVQNSPLGLAQIDDISFHSQFGSTTTNPSINLLLDELVSYEAPSAFKQLESCDDLNGWSNNLTLTNNKKEGSSAIFWDFAAAGAASFTTEFCDFSQHEKISFWVYNNINNGQRVRLILDSDVPSTSGGDYYFRDFQLDFTGWKKVELSFNTLKPARTPFGKDKITKVSFLANAWSAPDTVNEIVIDDVRIEGALQHYPITNTSCSPHPRLYVKDWNALKTRVNNTPDMKLISDGVIARANLVLNKPVSSYTVSGGRLITVSREVLSRVKDLSYAYGLTGDVRYLNRAYSELEAAAGFPDWNPGHFLDVGEMTQAFAIGYDWLYNDLTPPQREVVRNAIVKHGLEAYMSETDNGVWWLTTASNWSGVCNGGVGVGALAVAETHPELAQRVVNKAIQGMSASGGFIDQYAPDGAWPESPAYWGYSTRYLINFMAALETSEGNTFNLMNSPGFSKTGRFPIHMLSPIDRYLFNYGDGPTGSLEEPCLFWLGNYFNDELLLWYQKRKNKKDVFDVVWYPTLNGSHPNTLGVSKDAYFGDTEVAAFRTEWDNTNATYFAFKAGKNNVGHSQLDLGSFILEAEGVRWAQDLGNENYSKPGYVGAGNNTWDGQRWTYYRARAEANNTILINPGALLSQGYTADQDPAAETKIIRYNSNNCDVGNVIADLTDAYDEYGATSVKRGMAFINTRSQILLQDEVEMASPSSYYWFMTTKVPQNDISISTDGKTAILVQGGKQLICEILEPLNARFQKFAGQQIAGLPTNPNQSASAGKIGVKLENITSGTLRIIFSPGNQGDLANYTVPQRYELNNSLWPEAINLAATVDKRSACNSFTWIDGNTYNSSNSAAIHTISGGSVTGCDSVVSLNLTINTVDASTTNNNDSIKANNASASYRWLDCSNNFSLISGETNSLFLPAANGNYAVEVTQNSCVDTSSCVSISITSIMENSFGNQLILYPNPAKGDFSIDLGSSYEVTTVDIRDVAGKSVLTKRFAKSQLLRLNADFSAGVYFVTIESNSKKAVIRLLKE